MQYLKNHNLHQGGYILATIGEFDGFFGLKFMQNL